jgi:membrane protein DedA with SNARE-associated domain
MMLPAMLTFFARAAESDGLTGFTGFAADVIVAIGEIGVGILTFVETVIPPIPSEVVLSLSGYLAERGRMSLLGVIVAATVGGVLGALLLYALGAWFGETRAKMLLAKLPLVDLANLENASGWFHRHGPSVVFFGRFVPIVRSLVSLPAGAQRMPVLRFVGLTALGSVIWNTLLVGAGYLLGTQYELVEGYLRYLDYVVVFAVVVVVGWFLVRKQRQRRVTTGG